MSDAPYPRALARFPTLRQSLLGAFDLCHLEPLMELEGHYIGGLDDPDRIQWSSHEQARGIIGHRWVGVLLKLLSSLGQDALADDVECERCGAQPNQDDDEGPDYQEGNACPVCDGTLKRVALTDVALDLLYEVQRQMDVEDRDVVTLPAHERRTLEWVVMKFAREQRFKIGNLVSIEERLEATIEYPNPVGGTVTRRITGQIDALFAERDEDGRVHAHAPDWKFTWAIPGASSISTEGYWQQRVYALLVLRNYPSVDKVTLREVYPYFGAGESGTENHREATLSRDDLPRLEQQVAVIAEAFDRTWEAFETERELRAEWDGEPELREELGEKLAAAQRRLRALSKPSPGNPQCGYCPAPHRCPIVESVRVHGTVRTAEDAKRVAAELVVINRSKKHREEALKVYLAADEGERPTAEVAVSTEGLRTFTDHPPGLPEGVEVASAKGRKVYAMVEGQRVSSPKREEVAVMLAAVARGESVNLDDYYRPVASSTLRLVEAAVPVDEPEPARSG